MKRTKFLIVSVVIVTVMLSSFSFYFYQMIYVSNFLVQKEGKFLFIPPGASFDDVQKIIYDEGFVNDPVAFAMLAKFMKYDRLVKPRKFQIEKNSNNFTHIIRIGFHNSTN